MKFNSKLFAAIVATCITLGSYAQNANVYLRMTPQPSKFSTIITSKTPTIKLDSIPANALSGLKIVAGSRFKQLSTAKKIDLIPDSGRNLFYSTMPNAKVESNSRMPVAKLDTIFPYRYTMPVARIKTVKRPMR